MKLRTFEGEPVTGELTTEYPVSRDGFPVLLVNGEPFNPEEVEFFLESTTQEELELLKRVDMTFQSGRDKEYGKT